MQRYRHAERLSLGGSEPGLVATRCDRCEVGPSYTQHPSTPGVRQAARARTPYDCMGNNFQAYSRLRVQLRGTPLGESVEHGWGYVD